MTNIPDAHLGRLTSGGVHPSHVAAHPNYRAPSALPIELRRTGVPQPAREWVRRQLGSPVVAVRRLPGASSTAVHLLTLGNGHRVVLRRYAWPGFLEDEPVAVQREVDALRFAEASSLRVPTLLGADVEGLDVGDGVPVVLMERIPGRALGAPDVTGLAEAAASLHDVAAAGFEHRYFRWFENDELRVPRSATDRPLWEWALDVWSRPPSQFSAVFIHRDFHPGNVLWVRGAVSGIVDWANACRGPAACDVATCRGDLMRTAGPAAADAFLDAYQAVTGRDLDPYWEVIGVLEHGPSPWTDDQVAESEYRLRAARRAMG